MIRDKIRELLKKNAEAETNFSLEKPERAEFGDYAANLALVLAKERKENPRKIAEDLIGKIKGNREAYIFEKIEIAGPGFINFFLNKDAVLEEFKKLSKLKTLPKFKTPKSKIQIEFISVNPTGELHIGHGRGAFYGEALSQVLKLTDCKVEKEYFINDSKESNQIKELGKTAIGEETGYLLEKEIQKDNKKFIEKELGIKFNNWISEEKNLRQKNYFNKILEIL